jgi:ABC-type multidrug transport system fused ATPase/permease subunit
VASILPFIAVLTNPNIVETNFILQSIYEASNIMGVENKEQFIFALGCLVFILLIISLSFKAFTTYVQFRFVQMLEYSIAKRLVEGYLHQPYSFFLNRNSAELGKTILSEVGAVVGNGITPLIELIGKGISAIALISLLIIADPKLALIIGSFLGGAYLIIYVIVYKYIESLGNKRLINNRLRFAAVSESFGAIKEVKLGRLEETYIKIFSKSAKLFAYAQASFNVIAQLPRFILEAIAFGGILLIILYVINQAGSFNSALPILSLYVFAGYRLMPSLQQIYGSFTQLTFVGPSLNKLYDDLKNHKQITENKEQEFLKLNKKIELKNVSYNYPNAKKTALKKISLSILAKSKVGFVGPTGSGKTTTVDIILGLLKPQNGTLEIDGKVITNENAKLWQRSIGYVPQHIYLSDDTVSANIAFGIEAKFINQKMVVKAAKIANLHEFVIKEMPEKYNTTIGERGIRLSGGQRQRIGIARALYNNPQLLVLDEATSALDNQTEQAVMDAINNLSKDITILMITHRLNIVKNCDIIYKIDNGRVKYYGGTHKMVKSNLKTKK